MQSGRLLLLSLRLLIFIVNLMAWHFCSVLHYFWTHTHTPRIFFLKPTPLKTSQNFVRSFWYWPFLCLEELSHSDNHTTGPPAMSSFLTVSERSQLDELRGHRQLPRWLWSLSRERFCDVCLRPSRIRQLAPLQPPASRPNGDGAARERSHHRDSVLGLDSNHPCASFSCSRIGRQLFLQVLSCILHSKTCSFSV